MSYVQQTIRRFKVVDIVEGVTVVELEIDEELTGRTDEKKVKELTEGIFQRLTKTYSPQRLRVIEQ